MEIIKKHWVVVGGGFIFVVLAGLLWSQQVQAPVPAVSGNTSTTTPVTTSPVSGEKMSEQTATSAPQLFPINTADNLSIGTFKSIYAGNDVQIQKVKDDITLLTDLLGKGKYDDYDLYNGIANDYSMLGDGVLAYKNFNRAIAVHPTKGLAYVNLARLMDQLGAYQTAADAYTKSITVEPKILAQHVARLEYLTRQFSTDTARLTAAFADASKQFGDAAPILTIEAEWLTSQKRYVDAIKAWETVKILSMAQDTSPIDAAIARLKAKQ
jgi:tetratricopeptide (TPR) repeat protein